MSTNHRTQVCIIGSGPSGLMLGQLLLDAGIDAIILERVTQDYVLSRVRAGVLEMGTVSMIERAGAGQRMRKEGIEHTGVGVAFNGVNHRVDSSGPGNNQSVMIYGQTEVTKDLMDRRSDTGGVSVYQAENVVPHDFDGQKPYVTYTKDGVEHRVDCDFIAGCDGFHGASRKAVPEGAIQNFNKVFPFGWLGVLAEVPPVSDELVYARHERGFALCSMRSHTRSRYYIQCSLEDKVEDWSDQQFWDELRRRLPQEIADGVTIGPSFEKSIAPLRSFVAEPMRFGRMFLVGDAAHIVPPTGAKGLNLAASDVYYLFEGLQEHYKENSNAGIDNYSARALMRIWNAVRFSCWLTNMLHRFPDDSSFDQRIQEAELSLILKSDTGLALLAENYVGMPY
ncbi:MAG: 4-hydroxybenzoate 3-monooxygenase [Rhizobiales bacterium]|nr:4-hydroxybenzoate 3-monooxygenase [Hyphomicrobiales bacterium]